MFFACIGSVSGFCVGRSVLFFFLFDMADAAARQPAADVTRAPMQEWTRFPLYLSQIGWNTDVGDVVFSCFFFGVFLCIFLDHWIT